MSASLSASRDSFEAVLRRIARLSHVPVDHSHAPPLAQGTELADGRFVIRRLLGRGGMGTVYEAIDRARDARVAIKSIGTVEASRVHRFKREFRALSDVIHPSLVRLHELFACDGTWFFTMELVEGVPFIDHVRPMRADIAARALLGVDGGHGEVDRLDLLALQRALVQLTLAVQAIHAAGKLHCDLKPSNVLVTPRGQVVVLDFGLAIDASESSAGGTPAYMAPEARAVPASDWYAVGVMLFEALTGRLPFDGDSAEILAAKRGRAAPELVVSEETRELGALCADLLAREPGKRPDGDQILSALGAIGARPHVRPAPVPTQDPEQVFVGRKREIGALRAAFTKAERGQLVACRVHGASGMGKSTLVQQAFRDIECGRGVVLRGRCHEHEAIPYKLIDGVIDELGTRLTELGLAGGVGARELAALVRLFPSLGRFAPLLERTRGASLPLEPDALRQLAARGLCDALRALRAHGPVVIHIDDAQWGDLDGARLLGDALAPPAPGLLLCIGHRSDASCSGLDALWRALAMTGADQCEVPVRELSTDELRELVSSVAGTSAIDLDRIAREGAGMPMFASELARRARSGASPTSLDEALVARARELPEDARRVLTLVAVSGVPTERSVLERAAAVAELDRALGLLRVQRLVTTHTSVGESWVEPFHDRIREAIASAAHEEERRAVHGVLARALEAVRPDEVERLAIHLEAHGEHAGAARNAILAAKRAEQALAFDRAADWYMRAFTLGRFEGEQARTLHFEHAAALAAAERGREAAEALMCAALGADVEETGLIEVRAAEYRLAAGDMAAGISQLVDHGLGAMGLLPRDPARVLEALGTITEQGDAQLAQHLHRLEHAPDDLYSNSPPASLVRRIDALWSAALDLNLVGEPMLGSAAAAQQLVLAFEAREPLRLARAAYLQASSDPQLVFGRTTHRYDTLMSVADHAARGVRDPRIEVFRQCALATAAHHLGRADLCRRAYWAASEAGSGVPGMSRVMASVRVAAYGALGDLARYDELRGCADAWNREVRGNFHTNGAWVAAICDSRPALDDNGCELYLERNDALLEGMSSVQRLVCDLVAVFTEHYLGRVEAAWLRAKRAEAEATKMVIPMLARQLGAIVHRAVMQSELGRAASGRRDAIPAAEAALAALEAIGQPSMESACLSGRASLAYLRDDREGALELLDRAIAASVLENGNPGSGLCAQRIKGRLIGGSDGARLIERADTGLRQLTVRNPARWSRMLMPGFSAV